MASILDFLDLHFDRVLATLALLGMFCSLYFLYMECNYGGWADDRIGNRQHRPSRRQVTRVEIRIPRGFLDLPSSSQSHHHQSSSTSSIITSSSNSNPVLRYYLDENTNELHTDMDSVEGSREDIIGIRDMDHFHSSEIGGQEPVVSLHMSQEDQDEHHHHHQGRSQISLPVSTSSSNSNIQRRCLICFGTFGGLKRRGMSIWSTPCGHLYCKLCLRTALRNRPNCPSCRGRIRISTCHRIHL